MILAVHILAVGAWLGCVLTEALFERALLGTSRENELILANLHKRVDLIVEIPAFSIAVLTGFVLIQEMPMSIWFMVKLSFAVLAVVSNIYCVYLVFQRVEFSSAGNWAAFERADHLQHKIGALVLLGILGASVTGVVAVA